jgi:hypothetical protein
VDIAFPFVDEGFGPVCCGHDAGERLLVRNVFSEIFVDQRRPMPFRTGITSFDRFDEFQT